MPRIVAASAGTVRHLTRIVAVLVAAATSVLLWRLDVPAPAAKAEVVWQVGLGSFSALLTALTIVFAVTVTPQTRWPSFGDLVGAIAVTSWLAVALVAILSAASGDIYDVRGLTIVGVVFTVVQLAFGLDTLLALMRFRSAAGRRNILMGLATRRMHRAASRAGQSHCARHDQVSDLMEEIEYAINRNDVAEIAARAHEIVDGWPMDRTVRQARFRLALQAHLLERLGRSVLYEALSSGAIRNAVPPLVQGALHTSWQLSVLSVRSRGAARRDEVPAAVALGHICRILGWLRQSAHERLQHSPDDAGSRQVVNTLGQARVRIVKFVDPDPPGFVRGPKDPWPDGFTDPLAALLWLSALTDFGGSDIGSGLYIFCEVLTGEKFDGNYWHGDCVFTEIQRRVGRTGHPLLRSCGGLGNISLELAAGVIAGLRNRRFIPPAGWDDDPDFTIDRRYLRAQVSVFATYDCLRTAEAATDWMAQALTSAPTQPSLGKLVREAHRGYREPSILPLRDLGERPAAVTLAALCRLAFHRPRQAESLARQLPPSLLAGALQHARFVFSDEGTGEPVMLTWSPARQRRLGTRRSQERELLGIVRELLADA
ncbi:hypothetical protein [Phytohabitans houttuyneae]|uniref:Uncharacterized protein n=1 Tax=Phytohabitans houttuyneae TaxID=1076126 RepID=A0A6V8JX50_9ACTN|nr:hypothetical protein [Phytohabitans houttuyneae]GFJ75830.1 hypothetical protein Phou_000100 [Phytohabitans houttuyneae]